ncbi:MAG: LacI family DNA-binding transcriptional regulator [Albidovulum sp.]
MTAKILTPTLHDVAARSGVSTATVSRALNFPDQVAEPTRTKVLAVVRDLGYSPNFGAKAMASRRTNTIGAIIPTMENAIFARGLQAFQDELRVNGFTLLVASSSYNPDQEEEQIHALVARGADGLLMIGHDRDERIYRFLAARRIPILVAWALDRAIDRPSVGFDNYMAMQALVREVIEQGHRRFAMISAPVAANDRARARVQGVRDAMTAAGLDGNSLPVIETPYGIENGANAFATLMTRPLRPTVVLCGNDVLAVGAMRRAREMGVDVPGKVSITGFDDIELAQVTVPGLTTVHVPHRQMGYRAAQLLVWMVQGNGSAETVELAVELRLRGSLAPPSAR